MGLVGKKAVEWPEALVYVLLSAILLIIGLYYILNISASSNLAIDFNVNNLQFSLLSNRIINSADCLAWEEPYLTSTGTTYTVHAGIIDESKFLKQRIKNCLDGKAVFLWLTDFDGNNLQPNITTKTPNSERFVEDYYLVKVHRTDGSFTDARLGVKIWF